MASPAHHGHTGHDAPMSGPWWLPLVLAILLGTAALVAGLIAWRAATHSGHAQTQFAISTQAVNNANALQQDASQAVSSERSLFVAYEDAAAQHDQDRATDDQGLMDPATLRAVNWWLVQPPDSRPASPFAAANPQWTTPRMLINARAALDQSVAGLASAEEQVHQSHELELLEAVLAVAFLTGGLTATLRSDSAQKILLGVSVVVLTIAAVGLAALW
jgi:hypothetical protein